MSKFYTAKYLTVVGKADKPAELRSTYTYADHQMPAGTIFKIMFIDSCCTPELQIATLCGKYRTTVSPTTLDFAFVESEFLEQQQEQQ